MRIRITGPSLATIVVGLAFVAIGISTYIHIGRFLDRARETTAVVIEVLNESATPNGRRHPVVRFTLDGKEVVVRSDEHHNVKPADTVQLLYDTQNPHDIEITTLDRAQRRRMLFSGIPIVLGLLMCVQGIRGQVS
jgi:hypothetical protein